jgi:hypothetical protein
MHDLDVHVADKDARQRIKSVLRDIMMMRAVGQERLESSDGRVEESKNMLPDDGDDVAERAAPAAASAIEAVKSLSRGMAPTGRKRKSEPPVEDDREALRRRLKKRVEEDTPVPDAAGAAVQDESKQGSRGTPRKRSSDTPVDDNREALPKRPKKRVEEDAPGAAAQDESKQPEDDGSAPAAADEQDAGAAAADPTIEQKFDALVEQLIRERAGAFSIPFVTTLLQNTAAHVLNPHELERLHQLPENAPERAVAEPAAVHLNSIAKTCVNLALYAAAHKALLPGNPDPRNKQALQLVLRFPCILRMKLPAPWKDWRSKVARLRHRLEEVCRMDKSLEPLLTKWETD